MGYKYNAEMQFVDNILSSCASYCWLLVACFAKFVLVETTCCTWVFTLPRPIFVLILLGAGGDQLRGVCALCNETHECWVLCGPWTLAIVTSGGIAVVLVGVCLLRNCKRELTDGRTLFNGFCVNANNLFCERMYSSVGYRVPNGK